MLQLKEIRKENGLLQKDLADALNRTVVCISKWESGKNEPDLDSLVKLADILDCSVDELLGRDRPADSPRNKMVVSDDEKAVVKIFRQLPQDAKTSLFDFLSTLEKYI